MPAGLKCGAGFALWNVSAVLFFVSLQHGDVAKFCIQMCPEPVWWVIVPLCDVPNRQQTAGVDQREGFRDIRAVYVSAWYLSAYHGICTISSRTSPVHPSYVRTIPVLYPHYIRTISARPGFFKGNPHHNPYPHYIRTIFPYPYDIRTIYRAISEAYIRRTSSSRYLYDI